MGPGLAHAPSAGRVLQALLGAAEMDAELEQLRALAASACDPGSSAWATAKAAVNASRKSTGGLPDQRTPSAAHDMRLEP